MDNLQQKVKMLDANDREALWEAMLGAEYQKLYWQSKALQYSRREHCLQIILAVLSSSAVLTIFIDTQLLWIWKVLAILTAIVATIQPFLNYTKNAAKMFTVSSDLHLLQIEYESLWLQIGKKAFSNKEFKELRKKEVSISSSASDLPYDDEKIQNDSYNKVLLSRGINDGTRQ